MLGLLVATGLLALGPVGGLADAPAEPLPLPVPAPPPVAGLLAGVGATAERTRVSSLPPGGTATDVETVDVALDGDGTPVGVEVEQRITLTGRGDYVIVERGPARRARALGDSNPPTLKFGAVLYAGFIPPGGRELAARLTLDPVLEAARLPLSVTLSFAASSGGALPLGPGGAVPGPGAVTVTLQGSGGADAAFATGDVSAAALAAPLDRLAAAAGEVGPRPPVAGEAGIPIELPAAGPVTAAVARVGAPLRVTGSVRLLDGTGTPVGGASLGGPAVTPLAGGGALAGTLADQPVSFRLTVPAAGRLELDLTAVPALDPRRLAPPGGLPSWAVWAAGARSDQERAAALETLVLAAAQSARIRDVSPYLTTDLRGEARTTLRVRLAPPPALPPPAVARPSARPAALALAALASLLSLANAELLRRRL